MSISQNRSRPRVGRLSLAMLTLVALAHAQDPVWKPAGGLPPTELRWLGKHKATLEFKDSAIVGKARWDMRGKLVSILWSHAPTLSGESQEIPTSYWPTAVAELQDGKTLLVAGKRTDGNTVIESWLFRAPELVPKDPEKTEFLLKPAPVERVDTVYDAAAQGKDLVGHMVRKLGASSNVLVQFVDSRAVYDVDVTAKPPKLTLVADPRAASVLPPVPQLAQRYTHVWAGDHRSRGYVYAFVNDEHDDVSRLVLLDADRNGVLDGLLVVSSAQWTADGWQVASNYK